MSGAGAQVRRTVRIRRYGSTASNTQDTRRLCTIAGLYKYAVEEDILEHSPAAHVRRPRLDYESHAVGLDRNELGALLAAAGLGLASCPMARRARR